jgi:hypothetical protein
MSNEPTWLSFEKAVAQVQAQFDVTAKVTHNEQIIDRLGHSRQFDVVIRGKFGGQDIFGVIECKDTKARVGSPEVDAFVTKSQDVKANLRILMSRRGFTKPALEKCSHYGIQALSLLGHDKTNVRLFPGTQWVAEHTSWARMAVTLRFIEEPVEPITFRAEELRIGGKKVMDWFTNYLLANEPATDEVGWLVNIGVSFETPQIVEISPGLTRECRAIEFHAERVLEKFERTVAVSGTGFYDWNARRATFTPGSQIKIEPVPMDFSQWQKVSVESQALPGFMSIRLVTSAVQFTLIPDAIDLEAL